MVGAWMLRARAVVVSVTMVTSVSFAGEDVLIIPDILTRTVGMYDAEDGQYLGDLVPNDGHFTESHCAVLGPDNLIYVSEQIHGKIYRYNLDGTFVDTFVDVAPDGLSFPKGMDFLIEEDGSHSLLVAALFDYVPGEPFIGRIARYLDDGTYDPTFLGGRDFSSGIFDLFVDSDNSIWYVLYGSTAAKLADGGIGRIDPAGQDHGLVLSARGATQVVRCPSTGNLLTSVLAGFIFGEPHFHEFEPDGTIVASWNIPGAIPAPHGIETLGNGMLLSVGDSGIWRVDPASGYSATLMRAGTGFRMVHRATLPIACPIDLDGSGDVGFGDLLQLLAVWGPCPDCPADLDGDASVGFSDLVALLADWGPCV